MGGQRSFPFVSGDLGQNDLMGSLSWLMVGSLGSRSVPHPYRRSQIWEIEGVCDQVSLENHLRSAGCAWRFRSLVKVLRCPGMGIWPQLRSLTWCPWNVLLGSIPEGTAKAIFKVVRGASLGRGWAGCSCALGMLENKGFHGSQK